MARLATVAVSLHCWQGDDVTGRPLRTLHAADGHVTSAFKLLMLRRLAASRLFTRVHGSPQESTGVVVETLWRRRRGRRSAVES
ncbi:MAG: L-rhamnose isomerase [Acidobacteria bacterium]|nr:L-rhamnose isomerase [Acidobacteriota bacterium]